MTYHRLTARGPYIPSRIIKRYIVAWMAEAESSQNSFGLQTLEIDLTLGAEGKIWFIAKGSAEASIKLTFGRPAATA
jgi:hypothetical protein